MLHECRYLLRFDDICPTMNWTAWEAIEAILGRHDVHPILAVVPDNRDPKLMVDPPRKDFWEQVRKWQAMGWTIAMHGYQHVYVNKNPGLIHLVPHSEFAGLSRQEQEDKLKKGLAIFSEHGVRADAWIAPSHSFDTITVELLQNLGISVISDGLDSWPFTDDKGMQWVPSQLWSFRKMSVGVWTICNHHNAWTEHRVKWFGEMVEAYAPQMADMANVLEAFAGRRRTFLDRRQADLRRIWILHVRPMLSRAFRCVVGPKSESR